MQLPPSVLAEMQAKRSGSSSVNPNPSQPKQSPPENTTVGSDVASGAAGSSRGVRDSSCATKGSVKQRDCPSAVNVTKRINRQGWITKQGGASGSLFSRETWKKRWGVLDQSRLIWSEAPNALPKGEVFIKGAVIETDPPECKRRSGFHLAIRHSERTLLFCVDTAAEQQQWSSALVAVSEGHAPWVKREELWRGGWERDNLCAPPSCRGPD